MNRDRFPTVLTDGSELDTWLGRARFQVLEIGRIRLTSGRIIAADPLVFFDDEPILTRVVPAGVYPVLVSIAHITLDQRTALACIRFREVPVDRWEIAETTTERPHVVFDDVRGYAVDSGIGAFFDADLHPRLGEQHDLEFLIAAHQENYVATRSWAMTEFDPAPAPNLASFSSGQGDGAYATYWGLDASGEPAMLLTDFGICDAPGQSYEGARPA